MSKSTGDILHMDMRLKHLTLPFHNFDMGKDKRQRHATLEFLKIDRRHPPPLHTHTLPIRGPNVCLDLSGQVGKLITKKDVHVLHSMYIQA